MIIKVVLRKGNASDDYFYNSHFLKVLDKIDSKNQIDLTLYPTVVTTYFEIAITFDHPSVKYFLDYFNVPDNLTLKERICYCQLLQETLT